MAQTLSYERCEVLPLQFGGVLKLVDHKMVDPRPYFFINERGIVLVDNRIEYTGRIGQEKYIMFLFVLLDTAVYIDQYPQSINILRTLYRCVVTHVGFSETIYHFLQHRIKFLIETIYTSRYFFFQKPTVPIAHICPKSLCRRLHFSIDNFFKIRNPRTPLPLKIIGRQSITFEYSHSCLSQFP